MLWLGWVLPATAAPNAPTITTVEGQGAVPGVTLYLNITTNITVTGNAEANKTIKIFDGAVQIGTTASNAAGAYTLDINLAGGSHSLTAVANDVSGDSSPSTAITVAIDLTLPNVTIQILAGGADMSGINYLSTTGGWYGLNGGSIRAIFSDAGGSGYDISTGNIIIDEINDAGTVLANIAGSTTQISSDTDKFLLAAPTADGNYNAVLANGKRYRITARVSDFAGNQKSVTKDFVIDNLAPQNRAEGTDIRLFYIFDADDGTISNPPNPAKLIPMIWVAGNGRYEIDPTYVNATLVDSTTTPHSVKFNHLGFYGALYEGGVYNPPPLQNFNTQPHSIIHSSIFGWDSSSGISYLSPAAPDANGNNNTYYFAMSQPLPNRIHYNTIFPNETTTNAEYRTYQIYINSSNPMPSHPSVSAYRDVTNAAITYWDRGHVYPTWDWPMLRIANGNDIFVEGSVDNLAVDQIVEIVDNNSGAIYGRAKVLAGNTTYQIRMGAAPSDVGGELPAAIVLPNKTSRYFYTRARTATKSTSGVCWSCSGGWVIHKQDDIQPKITLTDPIRGNYYHGIANSLGPANVPTSYRAEVFDYSYPGNHWATQAPLDTGVSKIELIDPFGAVLAIGSQTAWSVIQNVWGYTKTITLAAMPATEGVYKLRGTLQDVAQYNPNAIVTENLDNDVSKPLIYYVDNTAPNAINIVPGNGTVSSIPSFNADIDDPNLSNAPVGTLGSGANLDLANNQIDPYKRLGAGNAAATNTLTVPIDTPVGGQASEHRGNILPLGTTVQVWDTATNEIIGLVTVGNSTGTNATVASNSGGNITVNMTAGALTIGTHYTVFYQIPHFDSNDGVKKVAAVPTLPAIAPGMYAARITGLDKVGNSGTTISLTGIQMDPPTGTITLTPTPATVYILNTAPNERSQLDSSVIQGLSGTIVPDGTLVTVSLTGTSGSIVEPDANGVAADGFQIATAANGAAAGRIRFHLKAVDTVTFGTMTVNVSIGSATGTADVVMARPKVTISKAADVTTRNPGQVITYTITYTNSGNSVSNNTTIKDRLPNTVTYVAGSTKLNGVVQADGTVFNAGSGPSGEITVNAGSVAASGTGTVVFQATVK